MGSGNSKLESTINHRTDFYKLSDAELLKQVRDRFSKELERLQNVRVVEKGPKTQLDAGEKNQKKTPSQIIYDGKDYPEVNRTLTGVLALRWIMNDQYDVFVSGQAEPVRLEKTSFKDLRYFFEQHLQKPEDLFTLVLSMVVNDLGKDPELEEDYYHKTKDVSQNLRGQNHDMILLEAAKAGMVPCLNDLPLSYKEDIMLGLELGSQLNISQFAQAENVPISLEGLFEMRGHERAFNLKYMEQILDLAGAQAHHNPRGASTIIEPVFQGFKTVYEVSIKIIAGQYTLRQGYDAVLEQRASLLVDTGFRRLSVADREERALLRLLTMARTTTKEQANLFDRVFKTLDADNKKLLVTGLNVDGNPNETAVLPYYVPALLSALLGRVKNNPPPSQENSLRPMLRFLARVVEVPGVSGLKNMPEDWFEQAQKQQRQQGWEWKDGNYPGIVIERNLTKVIDTILGKEFEENPNILDLLEIPTGSVMQRRRTSHSLTEPLIVSTHHNIRSYSE